MSINNIDSLNHKLKQSLPTHVFIKLKISIVNELVLLYEIKINIFRFSNLVFISGLSLNHVRGLAKLLYKKPSFLIYTWSCFNVLIDLHLRAALSKRNDVKTCKENHEGLYIKTGTCEPLF